MADRIKYPIGIQTFSKLISNGYLYIDKTELIHDLVSNNEYVFLSRPRRFGKSLLMSTIESYFKGEKDLFEGLLISSLEHEWKSYPVFRFDLSTDHIDSPKRLIDLIGNCLSGIEREYGLSSSAPSIALRFSELIEQAYHRLDRKVVILIDEYDKPMLDCLHDDSVNESIKAELRGFYSVIKGNDRYIRFAMLTGITKFGKVSVFSGLNNLRDISMLPKFNAICGIAESEFRRDFKDSVAMFAKEHGISEYETWDKFKTMYDGYHFAARGEFIYNPFSVLNAFNDGELRSYWYASGSPSYLIKLIETYGYSLDAIEGVRKNEIELSDISDISHDFVPLLYQSGYLTIKNYDPETEEYVLDFPNREVNKSFWTSLANRFFRGVGGRSVFNVRDCVQDINDGRIDAFMQRMKSLFADTTSEPEKNKEIHFQNMMAIVAKMMGLSVRTEVHSSAGRCDMQILTDKFVYIFEFKIDSTPEAALSQIHEKNYYGPFTADVRTIILIGANFSLKTRTLDTWVTEKLRSR
ncbi:MAG: AAA family ATPase [Oscillibacter sp.]|nr:AAA family ATPase [Oscillibacter sp.]